MPINRTWKIKCKISMLLIMNLNKRNSLHLTKKKIKNSLDTNRLYMNITNKSQKIRSISKRKYLTLSKAQ